MNKKPVGLFERVLESRGLTSNLNTFIESSYEDYSHDPYLLTDMKRAVTRIVQAKKLKQKICIYGDYDIDGLTATSVLLEAFTAFGLKVEAYIPDRFEEGYGLNNDALDAIKAMGADVAVTVDCGSTSLMQAEHAKSIDLDLIITDHHTVLDELPNCIAVVNPKRKDNIYPFKDLAGVGVAFKFVQALQQEIEGLDQGQEKWLLDLVALGTVCDVVDLVDENRMFVKWGIEVMKKTRRTGLLALLEIAQNPENTINTRTFGFRLGPRLNAAGRLKHAKQSLELLNAHDHQEARKLAKALDELNSERRHLQSKILKEANEQINYDDPVIVLANKDWSHGVVGIVAAKLLEKYRKPTFVMQHLPDGTTKGSARAFGDFKAVDAIRYCEDIIISGGGHAAAGGCTLPTNNFMNFKEKIIEYYQSLNLTSQDDFLKPNIDLKIKKLSELTTEEVKKFSLLEPFGRANPEPHFLFEDMQIIRQRLVGAEKTHLQLVVQDSSGATIQGIAFNQEPISQQKISPIVTLHSSSFRPGMVEFQLKFL